MTEALEASGLSDRPAGVDAERSISPIAGRFGLGRTGKGASVAVLAAGCGLFLLATARHPTAKAADPQTPAKQVVAFEPATPSAPPTLADPGAEAPALTTAGVAVPALSTSAGLTPQAGAAAQQQLSRSAPILAFSRNTEAPTAVAEILPTVAVGRAEEATELDRLRRSSSIGLSRATRLPDRSFLILAGTSIPCILQAAMDTATPGYVSCVVPSDVYSENGAVVLLEKGTKVLGEYRGGLKQGQARLFVLWTRAVTPDGVAVSLASPAADALGRSGFNGDLDTHFWQRFGGAILLSVIDNGLSAMGRGRGSVTFQAPATAANTALQSSIDIPPTLRKAAGGEVAIFAAQDFDFSGVYGVKAR